MYKHSTIHRMKYQHDGGAIAYPPYELFSHGLNSATELCCISEVFLVTTIQLFTSPVTAIKSSIADKGLPRRLSENSKINDFAKINSLLINELKIQFFKKLSSRTAS
ncbi:Uncharacterised protein [Candidatus Venteria ishoeyi]|uniref:Uncharacterized protein n=1 Tax=Candidatus Venteria ishoeyi TaxID=1899563 RepID=A0A1H6FE45_9GAMM|nr:Uncharacterised protein [Candidatus Venteria ishoeyi]